MHTVTFWFLCVFVCTYRYTYICSFLKFWRHLDVFGWFWSPEYCRISEPFCWGEVLDWRSASALYLSLVTCKPVDISNIANPLFHGLFFEMKFCRFLGKTQLNPIPWSPLLGSLSEIYEREEFSSTPLGSFEASFFMDSSQTCFRKGPDVKMTTMENAFCGLPSGLTYLNLSIFSYVFPKAFHRDLEMPWILMLPL